MSHPEISTSKEPIRLFRSDVLEFFTHVHPAVVVIVWVPVVVALVWWSSTHPPAPGWWPIPLVFLAGLVLWTLVEYLLHRFLFHMTPRTPWQERFVFLLHGVHHAQPMIKTRLVMPPAVSIPLAALLYALFWLVFRLAGASLWMMPTFAGLLSGYIVYDLTHYSLHHFRPRSGYGHFQRQYHMRHHQEHPVRRFGVSSPVWDYVWGTQPR